MTIAAIPTGKEMNDWVETALLGGDVPQDCRVFQPTHFCGEIDGEEEVERDWCGAGPALFESSGLAVRLCEILHERKGWLFVLDQYPSSWLVSVQKTEKPFVLVEEHSAEHLPAAVCQAAWEAWHREHAQP